MEGVLGKTLAPFSLLSSRAGPPSALVKVLGFLGSPAHCQAVLGSSYSVWPGNRLCCECDVPALRTWEIGKTRWGQVEILSLAPVFLTWKGDGIPCLLGGGRELGPKAQDRKEHSENNYKP